MLILFSFTVTMKNDTENVIESEIENVIENVNVKIAVENQKGNVTGSVIEKGNVKELNRLIVAQDIDFFFFKYYF